MRPGAVAYLFALMALFTGFSVHHQGKQAGGRPVPYLWSKSRSPTLAITYR